MRRSMVRVSCFAVALASGVAACSGGAMSESQARAATVATVDGGALKGAALERWLLKDDSFPAPVLAQSMVTAWVNTAALLDNFRHGRALDDSATVDQVILPDAEHGMVVRFFRMRDSVRAPITDAQADSVAATDRVRVFQQLALTIPPHPDSATIASLRNRILALEKRAQQPGSDFTALVKEASQDSLSRAHGGYLPAVTQGEVNQMPPRLRVIWQLSPGAVSAPLASATEVHLIRRANAAESRPMLKAWLGPVLAHRADSILADSVVHSHHLAITPGAGARIRGLAQEPLIVRDTAALATWEGGALSPVAARRELLMLDPRTREAIIDGSDSLVDNYLRTLASQRIMIAAVVHEPMPNAEARSRMAPEYRQVLAAMHAAFAKLPASLSPADAATMYIDSIVAGKARFIPLPGALASVARNGVKITVDTNVVAGVYRAAAPAWRMAHVNDTTHAAIKPPAGDSNAAPE